MEFDENTRVLVTPDHLIGYEIDGRYRLDAIVGGGGMGVVYRTTQRNLNREIAIKLLKLEENEGDHRVERFRREIDIVSQLSHPNIVRVFDSGCDKILGLHYIAMELIDGISLDELLRDNRVKTSLALDIAREVAAALTEPHKTGIVHRDIKPANVLITVRSDDTVGVKVVDFGIARTASKGGSKITTTGVVVGSPMYMAPEVARGEQLDGRTDLYSLAVMLYEMITGAAPFGGSTPVAIMLRHAVEEPPSMANSVPDDFAYPELVELVDGMLSKERKHRPESAKVVMRRIDEIRAAHGLTRPRVDANATLRDAFAPYLVRHRMMGDSNESGPYDVTLRVEEKSHSDTFSGWLVSSAARTALMGGVAAAASSRLAETERKLPEPAKRSGNPIGIGLAIAALAAIIVLGVVVMQREPDPPESIGGPPPLVDATPEDSPTSPPEVIAQLADAEAEVADAGTDAETPDAGAEPTPAETTPPVDKKPPKVTRDKVDEKKTDNVEKGLDWLNQK